MKIENALIVLICLSLGCSNEKNSLEDVNYLDEVAMINKKLKEVASIYDSAITDATESVEDSIIISKYESKVQALNTNISMMIDSLSKKFIARQKTQKEYEDIMRKIEIDQVKSKAIELDSFGIVFDLQMLN